VIADGRKGRNVVDLMAASDDNLGTYGAPPGKYRQSTHGNARVFTDSNGTSFAKFTCAGSAGCHGSRNSLLSYTVNDNITTDTVTGISTDGPDYVDSYVRRVGIAAISGAHHNSYDGAKADATVPAASVHNGQLVADGYRFIPGLKGYGNEAARWQNVDANSHNEYFGNSASITGSCSVCHDDTGMPAGGSHLTTTGIMKVPNQSMSGFCSTCHGNFHTSGNNTDLVEGGYGGGQNGVSGAFLRHPSDYVLPTSGEYSAYTTYSLTAPVARPAITAGMTASATVTPGTDMVMCMSCHMAHGSQYDAMLRFDYTEQQAGNAGLGLDVGCLACHTSKGILPENR
jgi:hypothetical protein